MNFSYSASFCESSVQNSVSFGRFTLYCSRSFGVSTTAFMCDTAPHERASRSVASFNGSTTESHVASESLAVMRDTTSRALGEQLVDRRRDVVRLYLIEARQPTKVEQRIFGGLFMLLRCVD